jgi:hypothetical protein
MAIYYLMNAATNRSLLFRRLYYWMKSYMYCHSQLSKVDRGVIIGEVEHLNGLPLLLIGWSMLNE